MPTNRNRNKSRATRVAARPDAALLSDNLEEPITTPSTEPLTEPVSSPAATAPDDSDDLEDSLVFETTQALAPPPGKTAGAMLREAREATGLTIEAVSAQIKLAPRQVEALENDNLEALPMLTFVRGFVRNYARMLKLDPEAVLDALPLPTHTPAASPAALTVETPTARMTELPEDDASFSHVKKPWAWIVGIIIILLILGGLLFNQQVKDWFQGYFPSSAPTNVEPPDDPDDSTPMPAPTPASEMLIPPHTTPNNVPAPTSDKNVATPGTSTVPVKPVATAITLLSEGEAAPATTLPTPNPDNVELQVIFDDDSWLEVYDRKGTPLLMETGKKGTQRTIVGKPPLTLKMGRSNSVRLLFQGNPVDPKRYVRPDGGVSRLKLNASSISFE